MTEFEKIINDAWDNKDQVNQNSDKNLKDTWYFDRRESSDSYKKIMKLSPPEGLS